MQIETAKTKRLATIHRCEISNRSRGTNFQCCVVMATFQPITRSKTTTVQNRMQNHDREVDRDTFAASIDKEW